MNARRFVAALFFIPLLSTANMSPIENIVAPGGNIVFYINGTPEDAKNGGGGSEIELRNMKTSRSEILLKATPSDEPKDNLGGFSRLRLSPDSKTLFFQSMAWATSDAIHSLDIASKKTQFVTDGTLVCIVGAGEYQGHLIVQQHRYFVQGGSYDFLYLYDVSGKKEGLVATDTIEQVDLLKLCQSMTL